MGAWTYYRCSQFGHLSKYCTWKVTPLLAYTQRPLAPTLVHSIILGKAEGESEVVIGTIPIPRFEASVIFIYLASVYFIKLD